MSAIEARVERAWLSLSRGDDSPRIGESSTLRIRGFEGGESIIIGLRQATADGQGRVDLRLSTDNVLCGHLGRVEVWRGSGASAGEFEIVADKMSEDAFETLRSDLERCWTGLIFDAHGASSLRGEIPSPDELWQVIKAPLREIAAEPRSVLAREVGVKRLEAVRRPSELTASVVRASPLLARTASGPKQVSPDAVGERAQAEHVQRAGRSPVIVRDVDIPENALVAETLRRLAAYSRRRPDGLTVATRAMRALRGHPFSSCRRSHGGIEAAKLRTLHDPRYRAFDRVLRILDRPEAYATEGPGEARWGVKGMIRLYEYWVFLQVLEACGQRFGAPLEPGFDVLRQMTRGGVARLEIPEGTTVQFPNDVHVAFEPRITSSGRGWMTLENVPHPDRRYAQDLITPDVVVLRLGSKPEAVVVDAKYVGRSWVEFEAAKLHARYSRIRLRGVPLVRHVLAAHPHDGINFVWAGYGSVPMVPGRTPDLGDLLPSPGN
ncbi:MAG: hypothetical protein OXB92_07220 [Acidimicrobiaceae bacterium]|nr:hypothetical protein [Acidimicrobiia bacterium]MCY4493627.1 hypothetical protein [Acidimicrobiaceae bacterium]